MTVDKRFCTCCGKLMDEGFVIEDGKEYFCTDECLHKYYSEQEYNEMYEKDLAYWTIWDWQSMYDVI